MTEAESVRLLQGLPHQGAMRLIDSVIHVDDRTSETISKMNEARARLFCFESKVEAYLGIELIAQSAALPLIRSSEGQRAHRGVIAQVRSSRLYPVELQGMPELRTKCEVELMLEGKVASVQGVVYCDRQILCEAVITLAVQGD